MMKRILASIFCFAMILTLVTPAMAESVGGAQDAKLENTAPSNTIVTVTEPSTYEVGPNAIHVEVCTYDVNGFDDLSGCTMILKYGGHEVLSMSNATPAQYPTESPDDCSGQYSFDFEVDSSWNPGTYTVRCVVTDTAGQTAPGEGTFTIDTLNSLTCTDLVYDMFEAGDSSVHGMFTITQAGNQEWALEISFSDLTCGSCTIPCLDNVGCTLDNPSVGFLGTPVSINGAIVYQGSAFPSTIEGNGCIE